MTVAETLTITYDVVGHDPIHEDDRPEVTSPEAAAALLVPRMQKMDRECCLMATLDSRHRLLSIEVVSIGSVDHTFMAPREVYRLALLRNAVAIVLAHNHPSGDPTPSPDDKSVTRRLSDAGELVGITLLDHLVVGHKAWTSMARSDNV